MELQLVYYDNAQLTAATAAPAKAPYPADAIAVVSYLFEVKFISSCLKVYELCLD